MTQYRKGLEQMAKEAKFYTLDDKKKVIVIDKSVIPTAADETMLRVYLGQGYKIREKSAKRAEAMAKKANADLSNDDIVKALEKKPDLLEQYNAIRTGKGQGKGFFAARSWYKETVLGQKPKGKAKK